MSVRKFKIDGPREAVVLRFWCDHPGCDAEAHCITDCLDIRARKVSQLGKHWCFEHAPADYWPTKEVANAQA